MNKAIIIICLLLSPCVALAAPGKPSVSVGATTLTLEGSSFGAKSTAAPMKFDNFDDGTEGESIATGGYWSVYASGADVPTYESANGRTGSTYHSYNYMELGESAQIRTPQYTTEWEGADKSIYISFYMYVDRHTSESHNQLKVWRLLNYFDGGTARYPSLAYFHYVDSNFTQWTGASSGCTSSSGAASDYYGIAEETWQRVEIIVNTGTVGGDGTWEIHLDESLVADDDGAHESVYNNTCYFHQLELGEWNSTGGTGRAITMWDDVYIDNSWARVEVCNSGKTHCELQPPTAWSASSITATLNQGSFADDDTVYAYVIDSVGDSSVASDSFTFGDAEATPTPTSHASGHWSN
jgi:hypothetical protein